MDIRTKTNRFNYSVYLPSNYDFFIGFKSGECNIRIVHVKKMDLFLFFQKKNRTALFFLVFILTWMDLNSGKCVWFSAKNRFCINTKKAKNDIISFFVWHLVSDSSEKVLPEIGHHVMSIIYWHTNWLMIVFAPLWRVFQDSTRLLLSLSTDGRFR